MSKTSLGFIALKSLKQGPSGSAAALADIRRIYFKTTRRTIEHDLAHAIGLFKALPTEEERERAAVYMDGLSQMRSEWAQRTRAEGSGGKSRKANSGKNTRRTTKHG